MGHDETSQERNTDRFGSRIVAGLAVRTGAVVRCLRDQQDHGIWTSSTLELWHVLF